MFDLWCPTCQRTYLVGPRRLLSLRNTSRGPVGHARCPDGHVTVVEFRLPSPVPGRQPQPGSAA